MNSSGKTDITEQEDESGNYISINGQSISKDIVVGYANSGSNKSGQANILRNLV